MLIYVEDQLLADIVISQKKGPSDLNRRTPLSHLAFQRLDQRCNGMLRGASFNNRLRCSFGTESASRHHLSLVSLQLCEEATQNFCTPLMLSELLSRYFRLPTSKAALTELSHFAGFERAKCFGMSGGY